MLRRTALTTALLATAALAPAAAHAASDHGARLGGQPTMVQVDAHHATLEFASDRLPRTAGGAVDARIRFAGGQRVSGLTPVGRPPRLRRPLPRDRHLAVGPPRRREVHRPHRAPGLVVRHAAREAPRGVVGAATSRGDEPPAELVDVPRPEHEAQVAAPQARPEHALGRGEVGSHSTGLPPRRVGGRLGDRAARSRPGSPRRARAPDRRRARTATSARASAAPNARASRAVREYRCGWKTATTRRAPSVRAASIVAATSVGWWA